MRAPSVILRQAAWQRPAEQTRLGLWGAPLGSPDGRTQCCHWERNGATSGKLMKQGEPPWASDPVNCKGLQRYEIR